MAIPRHRRWRISSFPVMGRERIGLLKRFLRGRDATFEAFGLDGNVPFVAMRQGIQTYTIGDMERDGMTICEFFR